MTPFMVRVAMLVGAGPEPDEEPYEPLRYRTRPTTAVPVGIGADRHVLTRALTEQLLCEANAVLCESDDHLSLFDEAVPGQLAFHVAFRNRAVHVTTRFTDGVAYGRLVGDGIDPGPSVELEGPDAVADLLLLLIGSADLPTHTPS